MCCAVDAFLEGRRRLKTVQVGVEADQRLRYLGADAGQHHARAHQPHSLGDLNDSLGNLFVDRRHAHRIAGDIYGGAFRNDPALVDRTLRHVRFSSRGGYYMQLCAAFGWTSLPWLAALPQPTLVMAGGDDPLIPTINARIMHWLIPDARLAIVDCGHLFLVTRAAESARIVDAFLTEPRSRAGRASNHPLTTSRRHP